MTDLSVRGVYLYFEELRRADALETFLAECDSKKLTIAVSDSLYEIGKTHFDNLKNPLTTAVGPPCPACPRPPGL